MGSVINMLGWVILIIHTVHVHIPLVSLEIWTVHSYATTIEFMNKKQVRKAIHVYKVHNTVEHLIFVKYICTLPKTGTFCFFKLCVPESELLSLLVKANVLRYFCSFDEF